MRNETHLLNNNIPMMGSPLTFNKPTNTEKSLTRHRLSMFKKSIASTRSLMKHGFIPGGQYWDKKNKKWKNVNKTNVKGYYKHDFTNAGALKHIKKHKRVYISVDVHDGKVQHVYDSDGIIRLLVNSPKNRISNKRTAKSPISRKMFSLLDVIPY